MNLQTPPAQQGSRNYGVDLLRIISMMMVVLLHCLGQGGILKNTILFSGQYEAAWFLKIMSFCAVNCYGLISGYVCFGRKVKYSNLIYFIFQTTFYTLLITAIFLFVAPGTVGLRTILHACFPIAYNVYWYATSYFCLFFFMPYLNQLMETSSRHNMQKLLLTMTFVFCLLPVFYQIDIPVIKWGYTPIWLMFLYLIGSYVKKYGLFQNLTSAHLLAGYFIFGIGTWVLRAVTEVVTTKVFGNPKLEDYLIQYNSPTIVMCALFLLLYFSRVRPGQKAAALIGFLAPATFGVYLIHLEPLIWDYVLKDLLVFCASMPVLQMLGVLILAVLGIFFSCACLEKFRILLFHVLKIREFCVWLDKKIQKLLVSILTRLTKTAV